jgi:hypothetical protein
MKGLKDVKQAALFEKSAQKLLLIWATGVFNSTVQIKKVFLVLFVHKKNCFLPLLQPEMSRSRILLGIK